MFQRTIRNSYHISLPRLVFRVLSQDCRARRIEAYNSEKQRQLRDIPFEKVVVKIRDFNGEIKSTLMNDRISTYYDSIRHLSSIKALQTVLVRRVGDHNGNTLSVHERVIGDSEIELIGFNSRTYGHDVNESYWRTCANLMGALIETSFRSQMHLIKPESLSYGSGRFSYSARIDDIDDWQKPTQNDLSILNAACFHEFISQKLLFEHLHVTRAFALDIFQDNRPKAEFIDKMLGEKVILCKIGNYIDICDGSLISSSEQIGRFAVTDVDLNGDSVCFSGVSLPAVQQCSSYAWDLILSASRPSQHLANL